MLHERFDLEHWVQKFPLGKHSAEQLEKLCGNILTSPAQMALVEQIRHKVRTQGGDLGPPVPTDVCVWNLGDSPRRDVTKIGGVPFWPAEEPWPTRSDGQPYTFVAQICFADSRDLVPALPGDILVLLSGTRDFQYWSIHWFDRKVKKLLPPKDLPEAEWEIQPCYAALHRTADYPKADCDLFKDYARFRRWAGVIGDVSHIGGYWYLRGELPDPDETDDPELKKEFRKASREAGRMERQFIAQIYSVEAWPTSWPFVNTPTRRKIKQSQYESLLHIFDMGGVALFWNGKKVYENLTSG